MNLLRITIAISTLIFFASFDSSAHHKKFRSTSTLTTFEHVKRNNGLLRDDVIIEIANAIVKAASIYNIHPHLISAIARVESSYYLGAINKKSNDFGIMQVNQFNIDAYGFDKNRLLGDYDYSVQAGTAILAWFLARYPWEEAVRRYNCGTRRECINWKGPKRYLRLVKKFL